MWEPSYTGLAPARVHADGFFVHHVVTIRILKIIEFARFSICFKIDKGRNIKFCCLPEPLPSNIEINLVLLSVFDTFRIRTTNPYRSRQQLQFAIINFCQS